MPNKIKVFMVDDSFVVRRKTTALLKADDGIEVVGQAEDGEDALNKLLTIKPDVIILDIEMPKMDGIEMLKRLRKKDKVTPVIMFSSLTHHGAIATLDALAYGATDYVTKPSGLGDKQNTIENAASILIDKIKLLTKSNLSTVLPSIKNTSSVPSKNIVNKNSIQLIVIAASTGGPQALSQVFEMLPKDILLPPILIAIHMPAIFTGIFAKRLSTNIPVSEAQEGDKIESGRAYVAPGNYHMIVGGSIANPIIHLNQEKPRNFCRPSADVLFCSAANIYKSSTLGFVLTGMGHDGLDGCIAIKSHGGRIIIQDEPSSVVWGMPGAVYQEGLADEVVPIGKIADKIVETQLHFFKQL